MRPCPSPRPPGCSACTRTRSAPGATPAGCATTGSIRAATGATASATSSASSRPPRSARPSRPAAPSGRGRRRRVADAPARPAVAGSPRRTARRSAADPLEAERHAIDLSLIDAITRLATEPDELDDDLAPRRPAASATPTTTTSSRSGRCATTGSSPARSRRSADGRVAAPGRPASRRSASSARRSLPPPVAGRPVRAGHGRASTGTDGWARPLASCRRRPPRAGRRHPGARRPVGRPARRRRGHRHRSARATSRSPRVVADAIGTLIAVARRRDEVAHQLHRAEALRRVAGDIGSRLDLDRILSGLVDHAMVLFEADRAAVFLQRPDGTAVAEVSRGLSASYLASVRDFPARSLPALAVAARRPLFAVDYRNDPRGLDVRAAVVQEGFDTHLHGAAVRRRRSCSGCSTSITTGRTPGPTTTSRPIAALATQASVAIRAAQDFERMATWAAQLQSIQQLGARLNRLSSVHEIGHGHRHRAAPAHRLPQRPRLPARRATTSSRSRCRARSANTSTRPPTSCASRSARASPAGSPSTASPRTSATPPTDPRADTIPGTEDDLDESMLLAPMIFDDQRPRRARPLQARARPVHRRRPAPAGHLRELRRPGDGQRRHDRAAARAERGPRAAGPRASASSSRSPNRS